jgi:hypothetical protein
MIWHHRRMKTLVACAVLLAGIHCSLAADSSVKGKKLGDIDLIPQRVLQRSVSPAFFKSLLASPLEGWVTARGTLTGTRLSAIKVTRSDLKGLFDPLAVQMAKEMQLAGNYSLDSQNRSAPVLVHLLIYEIADGTMVLSFAHLDAAGGIQQDYYGSARILVLKDNKWTEIKGPQSLHGRGLAVRQGLRDDTALKVERLSGTGQEAVNYGGGPSR